MRKFVLAAILVLMASGAQAATLDVVGGQLMGASGVLVDGSLYDVQFLDGTCIALFNGCQSSVYFTFKTEASALSASQALIDQVFIDVPGLGNFDADPALTNGCESGPSPDCAAVTQQGFHPLDFTTLFVHFATNQPGAGGDVRHTVNGCSSDGFCGFTLLQIDFDSFVESSYTWAVWSPATVVPEPNTALLLSLGLTGLSWKGRRRNSSV